MDKQEFRNALQDFINGTYDGDIFDSAICSKVDNDTLGVELETGYQIFLLIQEP